LFSSSPLWLTDKVFQDYSTLLSLVVGVLELFTVTMIIGMLLSWGRKMLTLWLSDPVCHWLMVVASVLSVLFFVASVVAIVDAAAAVPTLYRGTATIPPWMEAAAKLVQISQLWFVVAAGIAASGYFIWVVTKSFVEQMRNQASAHWPAIAAVAFLLLLAGSVGLLCVLLSHSRPPRIDVQRLSIPLMWAVLVILSLVVRTFLVQYVGDVAAYVQSHTLDRFSELRATIKERVLKIAEAIYAQRTDGSHFDYFSIVLVGHSLGSVLAYDILNQLLLDDAAITGPGRPWKVAGRTNYLLTFGSPLNKIAFIFANQSKKRMMTAARERLAALVQPLIDSATIRAAIKWVNVYSPWDIISGRLDFYDPRSDVPGNPLPVVDDCDTEAVTFLAAHTEYWRNTLVFSWLHAMI
jgi:hypothetical protein